MERIRQSVAGRHLTFVREYLQQRGVQFRVSSRGETHLQVQWAADRGVVRNATTGGIVGAGPHTIPFTRDDLYDDSHRKRIAPRLAHLPRPQTLALVRGLLESDGGVSRGAEIYFTSASQPLAEGLRYQCLRLGVPVSGQVREREHPQDAAGDAVPTVSFHKPTRAFDLRVPAVPEIAALVGCKPIAKRNWITLGGTVFSRVRAVKPIAPKCSCRSEGRRRRGMTVAGLAHNGGKGAVCTYLDVAPRHREFPVAWEHR